MRRLLAVALVLSVCLLGLWGVLRLDSATPLPEVATLRHVGLVQCVAFSPDGKLLAAGTRGVVPRAHDRSPDGDLKVWRTDTWAEAGSVRLPQWVKGIGYHPDGHTLAVVTSHYDGWFRRFHDDQAVPGEVRLYDLPAFTERKKAAVMSAVHEAAFSPDGRAVAVAGWDGDKNPLHGK